ncbi:hypothetical protein [Streptomyces sp. NPDC006368]|uniref:hypothetical protein n=1 Tax=Streptomyces sp. NPDC006368 TaxID=3156760 RepID=UPI0033B54383
MNLRLFGIGAVAVVAALVPLVATAGPAGSPDPGPGSVAVSAPGSTSGSAPGAVPDAVPGSEPRSAPGSGRGLLAGIDGPDGGPAPGSARCGPELTSPHGIEAQTCVLTEGPDTWARTYYRNATGAELLSVLTLMAPGGRTVQTRCTVPADDEPGACESPREPTRGKPGEYTAVAEFAESGKAETNPLLLRSGSNSPESAGS